MLTVTRRLLELVRFSHTLFALPFALLSAALAWYREGVFRVVDLVGIVLCMAFARSAAMAFNRLADRRLDALNPRTAGRHLPAGTLSVATVGSFTLICSAGFVASTVLFLVRPEPNYWPLYLSAPVLLFVCLYSLTKRFTALAHFWLGASLMLAPLSAWIAIRGLADLRTPLLIGGAVFFWVAGFDILYACVRTPTSIGRPACTAFRPGSAWRPACGWPWPVMWPCSSCWGCFMRTPRS
jgi:4-hydroxybenzoate polyprenyltransferase